MPAYRDELCILVTEIPENCPHCGQLFSPIVREKRQYHAFYPMFLDHSRVVADFSEPEEVAGELVLMRTIVCMFCRVTLPYDIDDSNILCQRARQIVLSSGERINIPLKERK